MSKRQTTDERLDRMHWEALIRAMINRLGVERLDEVIDHVIDEMRDEERKLVNFAVETRRVEH